MEDFKGIYPAIATPLTEAGTLNGPAFERLMDYQLGAGVDGFYVGGAAGEGLLHDVPTRKLLARLAVNRAGGKAKVIVHVGACATNDAVILARDAAEVGADAISAVPPIFYQVGVQGLYQYYLTIAEASGLPLIIYHIPALTGVNLSLKELGNLFEIQNIQGIKFSDYNLFQLERIRERYPKVTVFSGNDEVFLPALVMGAHGSIGLTLNIMPKLYVELYRAFLSGHLNMAQELQAKANRVIQVVVDCGAGFVGALKAIMQMIGFDCGLPRCPIPKLDRSLIHRIRQELTEIGFFSDPLYTEWANGRLSSDR